MSRRCFRRPSYRDWAPSAAIAAAVAVAALVWCGIASAGLADERALADRFAPVVRLVTQDEECGPGEPYRPIDVDVLFGEQTPNEVQT